jgi:hypothetical protein
MAHQSEDAVPRQHPLEKNWAGSVCVDLYKSGVFHYRIADENDESKQNATGVEWTPHDTLPDSSEYQIKLISPNDSTVNDISDYYFSTIDSE